MKPILNFGLAAALCGGIAFAQADQSSAPAQTWTGLLVASACQASPDNMPRSTASGKMPRSTDYGSRDMNTSTPTVTPGEQNRTYEQQTNQADRSGGKTRKVPAATDTVATPPVDSVDTRGSAPLNDKSMAQASGTAAHDDAAMAKGMDSSCRIGENTNSFALRLSDGRMLRFDDAGNAKISHELQSGDRLKHKTKVFRTQVKGTLSGETITVDSIKI